MNMIMVGLGQQHEYSHQAYLAPAETEAVRIHTRIDLYRIGPKSRAAARILPSGLFSISRDGSWQQHEYSHQAYLAPAETEAVRTHTRIDLYRIGPKSRAAARILPSGLFSISRDRSWQQHEYSHQAYLASAETEAVRTHTRIDLYRIGPKPRAAARILPSGLFSISRDGSWQQHEYSHQAYLASAETEAVRTHTRIDLYRIGPKSRAAARILPSGLFSIGRNGSWQQHEYSHQAYLASAETEAVRTHTRIDLYRIGPKSRAAARILPSGLFSIGRNGSSSEETDDFKLLLESYGELTTGDRSQHVGTSTLSGSI
ncbi:unnamed protein product [Caenorhabditis brenneri]